MRETNDVDRTGIVRHPLESMRRRDLFFAAWAGVAWLNAPHWVRAEPGADDAKLLAALRRVYAPNGGPNLSFEGAASTRMEALDLVFGPGTEGRRRLANDPSELAAHVAARIESDLSAGRLSSVDGWLLSSTEVAVLFLLAKRPPESA